MYAFTLWNQSLMLDKYTSCINALLESYPTLNVIRFNSPVGVDPRLVAERIRLEILRDTPGNVLYVDPDNIPGNMIWTGDNVTQCCALNCRGGSKDTSVLYKPDKCEQLIQNVLDAGKNKYTLYFYWIQSWGSINGYPDNRYFQHLNYGTN